MSSPSPPPHEGAGAKRPRPEVKVSVIDHTYRDFSRTSIEDLRVPENRTVPGGGGPRVNAELFPAKLHQILSNPEYYNIVRWKPHGRAWSVENRLLLEQVVIPKHFSMRDVKSFYRSVNGWGFKVRMRITSEDLQSLLFQLHAFYYPPCFAHILCAFAISVS